MRTCDKDLFIRRQLTLPVGDNLGRNAKNITLERTYLRPLPEHKAVDYVEVRARVSSSATIDVRRTTYTVPSRLIGECLHVHLFDDRLECFHGTSHVITLARVYSVSQTKRAGNVNYHHVIHSLARKPQAFRYSQLRDDLLPNITYQNIWHYVDQHMDAKEACKFIVGCLKLAADFDCEAKLGQFIVQAIEQDQIPSLSKLQDQFGKPVAATPDVVVHQHLLIQYDAIVTNLCQQEVYHA